MTGKKGLPDHDSRRRPEPPAEDASHDDASRQAELERLFEPEPRIALAPSETASQSPATS